MQKVPLKTISSKIPIPLYADFQKDIFSINHNMLYRKYKGESAARFHITTPKTDAGNRLVPMMKMVKELLLEELEFQKEYGFCDEVVDCYSGFIFQNRFGGLLTPHDINRAIERICASYNKEEKSKRKKNSESRYCYLILLCITYGIRSVPVSARMNRI